MSEKGIVIKSTGSWYKVLSDQKVINARIPGKMRLQKLEVTNPVTVGDYVDLEIQSDDTAIISNIHLRENYIPRSATHGRRGEQILISNVDLAWVVQSIRQPQLKTGFIDRFLVTCEAYEVKAGVIINKTDLAEKKDQAFIEDLVQLYTGLGYPVLTTSIQDEKSIEALRNELKDRVSVLIGSSGVGKTSLLTAADPAIERKIREVSDYSGKGKHTTTFAELIPLEFGGFLADTPGIRELGLVNIEKAELSHYFPELAKAGQHCKFYNCTHNHEPGCNVMDAFEKGEIHAERYNSYLNILESLN